MTEKKAQLLGKCSLAFTSWQNRIPDNINRKKRAFILSFLHTLNGEQSNCVVCRNKCFYSIMMTLRSIFVKKNVQNWLDFFEAKSDSYLFTKVILASDLKTFTSGAIENSEKPILNYYQGMRGQWFSSQNSISKSTAINVSRFWDYVNCKRQLLYRCVGFL